MRLSSLFVVAALVVQVVACSSTASGTGNGTSGASGNGTSGTTTSGGAGTGGTGPGSCDSACAYYLGCKGTDSADNRTLCNQNCFTQGFTSQQLSGFVQLDCPSAIAAIEGGGGTSSSSSSSSGSSGSDCNGCAWDGSACIYLTGSGGNYVPCNRSCCP
jgi:hypothetical protein